jgi:hypothetical protein
MKTAPLVITTIPERAVSLAPIPTVRVVTKPEIRLVVIQAVVLPVITTIPAPAASLVAILTVRAATKPAMPVNVIQAVVLLATTTTTELAD